MKLKAFLLACTFSCLSLLCFSDEISVRYQLMNQETFEKIVVGNTIIGITSQSHSLYMLYFLAEGECEL